MIQIFVLNVSDTALHCRTKAPPTLAANSGFVIQRGSSGPVSVSTPSFSFAQSATPNITSVTPNSGSVAGGNKITLVGANLWPGMGGASVTIDGVACVVDDSVSTDASVQCGTGAARKEGVAGIALHNAQLGDGAVAPSATFSFVREPLILSASPAAGNIGTKLTLTGRGFSSAERSCCTNSASSKAATRRD